MFQCVGTWHRAKTKQTRQERESKKLRTCAAAVQDDRHLETSAPTTGHGSGNACSTTTTRESECQFSSSIPPNSDQGGNMVLTSVAQIDTQPTHVDFNSDSVQCVETHLALDHPEDDHPTSKIVRQRNNGEAVGAPLPMSYTGLHQTVSGCEHPPSQMKRRGNRNSTWWTCIGCGQRWDRAPYQTPLASGEDRLWIGKFSGQPFQRILKENPMYTHWAIREKSKSKHMDEDLMRPISHSIDQVALEEFSAVEGSANKQTGPIKNSATRPMRSPSRVPKTLPRPDNLTRDEMSSSSSMWECVGLEDAETKQNHQGQVHAEQTLDVVMGALQMNISSGDEL
eukprot:2950481-Amphidinium_carterae.8